MTAADVARQQFAARLESTRTLRSPAVVGALAVVPRERFLGPGPWFLRDRQSPAGRWTESDDPALVYDDVSVALDRDRDLYNGAPGTVAGWLDALDIHPGDRVVHIGAGTGYYTAILAELAGPTGHVTGIEIDAGLAARARTALTPWPWAEISRDAGRLADAPADVVVIHAGASHIQDAWLDGVRDGGRLLVPLTCTMPGAPPMLGKGIVFVLTRRSRIDWTIRAIDVVVIYSLIGERSDDNNRALGEALRRGSWDRVTHLTRAPHSPDNHCWLHLTTNCIRSENQVPGAPRA